MQDFPDFLGGSAGRVRLERADDLHAREGDCAPPDVARLVARIEGDAGRRFSVLRGGPAPGDIAVYREPDSEATWVPTGRVFLRFAEGVAAESRRAAIGAAGYRIDQIVDYAPHAAWLEAADGDVAGALTGLERLRALADVASVEPQLLAPRAWR